MRHHDEKNGIHDLPVAPTVHASLRSAFVWLWASVAVVVVVCLIGTFCRVVLGIEHGLLNIIPLLNLYDEATLPAWYSSILMYTAALLLGVIGWIKLTRRERYRLHWLALAGIFVLLSMDESISLHERLSWPMRHVVEPAGPYFYAWVIPATLAVLIVGLMFLRFVMSQPKRTRNLFIISGVIFLTGALGLEMAEGAYHARHGDQTPMFAWMVAVEEIMEMAGIALFIHALLDYLAHTYGGVAVVIDASARPLAGPAGEAHRETPAEAPPIRPGPGVGGAPPREGGARAVVTQR